LGFSETLRHRAGGPSGTTPFRASRQGLRALGTRVSMYSCRLRNIAIRKVWVAPMAIYSCNLASIGRTTHAPGTAGAHLRYISRDGAQPVVEAHVIPLDTGAARTWMDREEHAARANARLCDKVRVAIPRELDYAQRVQLVRDFVKGITGDRIPWMFAIHQKGEDAHNPHAHIVLRDRDLESGKRVLRLSDSARDRAKAGLEPKAVEWIRERWEHCANLALERAGHDERIDRRSLDAQGVDRVPTIHIGPRGEQVERHVQRPTSRKRVNGVGREIDYPAIDQGRTRKDRNAEIIDINLERAARSPDFETRQWAAFERDQIKLDRQLEKELAAQARKRTQEQRALKAMFRRQAKAMRIERLRTYGDGVRSLRDAARARVTALRERQFAERHALQKKQSTLWARASRILDMTGGTRRKQEAIRRVLVATHRGERSRLARDTRAGLLAWREAVALRFAPQVEDLQVQRAKAIAGQREMHKRGEAMADAKRQLREQAREKERQQLAELIRAAKAVTRQMPKPESGENTSQQQLAVGRTSEEFGAAARRREEIRWRPAQPRNRDHGPGLGR
jgi:hypothetical protein